MNKKHKKKTETHKSIKPNFIEVHWDKIVIVLLLVLPLLYFASFLSADKMIGGSDYLIGGYPFEKWILEQDELPLWYPHVFAGIPVLGAPVGGPLAPLAQLREIIPPHVVLTLTFIIFFFLAGLGTYLYLKAIGLTKYTAFVGAVIYQFIGNLATAPNAGHAGRAASIAMFPLMLFLIHSGLQKKRLLYFILFALAAAFAFFEGHFQITYYALLFILAYVIYYLIAYRKEYSKKQLLKIFGYGLAAVALLCLIMAAVWLPVLGGLGTAARGVERGYEYATSWAMPPREVIDLVIPAYSGILDNYWGMNSMKLHLEYFGLLALVFAIFTIIMYWKKPYVKFFFFALIPVFLVAIGGHTPVFRVFYTMIPGFKLIRAPALIFYLVSFGFVVLSAISFDNIFAMKQKTEDRKAFAKKFYIIASIMIGILLITGIVCVTGQGSIVQSMQRSLGPQLKAAWGPQVAEYKLAKLESNFPDFIGGIWRSFIFLLVIIAMIFISIKRKIKLWIFAITAVAITLVDQLPLVSKYLPAGPAPKTYYAADNAIRFIAKDKSIFRVFPTPWYEHSRDLHLLYHNIQSAGGYIPNPIQRYQEYIGAGTSVMFSPANFMKYPQFLNMLNIKYLIGPTLPADVSQYDAQTQQAIREINKYFSNFTLAFRGQRYSVFLNNNRLPRAYIVNDYEVLSGLEILNKLKSPDFDPRQVVILEHDPHLPHPEKKLPFVTAEITSYKANKIVCTAASPYAGFLVFTDNWHPDWKVFVDGEQKKLYRANYTFRAVPLEPGKHEVVFAYISDYFNIGKIISIIAFVLSIALCIIAVKFKI